MISLLDITYDIYEASAPDPNAPAPDPNAPAPDPNAPPAPDPGAAAAPALKKYILYTKLKELKQYLDMYINHSEDELKTAEIGKITFFISIILNFFDLFSYPTVKELSQEVLDNVERAIKGAAAPKS